MKRFVIGASVFFLLLAAITFVLVQRQELKQYESGFPLTGTYTKNENQDYLLFYEDDTFCSYKPFGKGTYGSCSRMENPNVYVLKVDGKITGYVFLGKGSLTRVFAGKSENYEKISDGHVYSNYKGVKK